MTVSLRDGGGYEWRSDRHQAHLRGSQVLTIAVIVKTVVDYPNAAVAVLLWRLHGEWCFDLVYKLNESYGGHANAGVRQYPIARRVARLCLSKLHDLRVLVRLDRGFAGECLPAFTTSGWVNKRGRAGVRSGQGAGNKKGGPLYGWALA